MVAPIDSSPMPCLPAMRGPDGEAIAATAISRSEYRGSWVLALRRSNQSVRIVRGSSLRSRCMIASMPSSSMRRCSEGWMPIM